MYLATYGKCGLVSQWAWTPPLHHTGILCITVHQQDSASYCHARCVYRIHAQVIDDTRSITLAAASTLTADVKAVVEGKGSTMVSISRALAPPWPHAQRSGHCTKAAYAAGI